ncbi:uncharacterized protein Dmoj_GI14338 [Drosophila mojavensis]|uniref:Glutaredoxin domain-containing protein n=2 Tax=Drosophila mojavensis TaxID=7230 RepID=B4L8L4_DROMO|nr:uncharacterized protein Dmoj_GI14338 [Drosophila mojavensis]
MSNMSNMSNMNNSNKGNTGVPKLELHLKTTRIRVNTSSGQSGNHSRAHSLTDSSEECDESSSSLSCDSLHDSHEPAPLIKLGALLPSSLLRDIRDRDAARAMGDFDQSVIATKINGRPLQYEADQYYNFHVNEHANYRSFGPVSCSRMSPEYESLSLPGDVEQQQQQQQLEQEDAFAGLKDVRRSSQSSTIRSSKGTVRGVKNRVRNGVATFLQLQQPNIKNYMEKDLGKVVLYTTSMGIIRETYAKCANVKQILRTLLVKFEERDVFMSIEYQQEMRERMHHETIRVPQLFVEGQHIGDADTVERLNESGELRQLLRPYKSLATAYTCQTCGGYRLLPCPSCSGSKKSVHRNHFTAEFVALKCMNCDEVGLIKCPNC